MGRTLHPYPHKPARSWDSSDPSQDEWPPCAWLREVGRVGASEVFLGKINHEELQEGGNPRSQVEEVLKEEGSAEALSLVCNLSLGFKASSEDGLRTEVSSSGKGLTMGP